MINLRYHIVSIVAVFLALGIGVLMGSTVVDRVTVDFLRNRIDDLERARDAARDEGDRFQDDLRRLQQLDEQFGAEGRDPLLRGRLTGVPVAVVGVRGVPEDAVDDLEAALHVAGAVTQGTVWLTPRFELREEGDAQALAQALGEAELDPDADVGALRERALVALADLLAGAAGGEDAGVDATTTTTTPEAPTPNALAVLREAGFVEYDGPPDGSPYTGGAEGLPLPGSRYVLVSGQGARVADELLAVPLARALSQARPGAVLAAEASTDAAEGEQPASQFVPALRRDDATKGALSTVDNLGTFYGELAGVLALEDLVQGGPVGHYGVGEGAQRLLPPRGA